MDKVKLTRRGALMGAAGAGLAVGACSTPIERYEHTADGPFRHGVASGDPDTTSVVLWTAVTSDREDQFVGVEVATDPDFENIVYEEGYSHHFEWSPPNGLQTYKQIADGLLPGTTYFYRWSQTDLLTPYGRRQYSPVGITRTLPEGAVEQYRIGVFSCSNYPAGHFNVYREGAENGALDLVLHLGDYIYEYPADGYASANSLEMNRISDPVTEILTYEDYVRRHAQYKSDPDLQALHAAAPWIMVWDDHETANDSYATGAENHDDSEGSWTERRDAAVRAWYDWTPSREREPLIDRRGVFEIGDLATLCMLETRLTARSQVMDYDDFPIDPNSEMTDENIAIVDAWKREEIGAEDRELMGAQQIADVQAACAASKAAGKRWRIIGNQVIMSEVNFPDFTREMPGWLRWFATRDNEFARRFINSTRFEIPFNLDMWDGFPAERRRLYAALREVDADVITVTGDVHSFWTNDLADDDGHRIGTELVTSSVSSPSPFSSVAAPGVDYGRMMVEANEPVQHCNMDDHGYIRLTLTDEAADAEYVKVSTILQRDYRASIESAWRILPADSGGVPAAERVS